MDAYLAIHNEPDSFSQRWLAYCAEHKLRHKVVDCLATGIIEEFQSTNVLLWHWSPLRAPNHLMATHIIRAAETMGLQVFPSTRTCWHYDDKIAQKYLLEAIGAPLVPTYVFYSLADALKWIDSATFPKVFKLRKGSGSANVRLARTADEARSLVKRMMAKGFLPAPAYTNDLRVRYRSVRRRSDLWAAIKRMPSAVSRIRRMNEALGREHGYVYFQKFIPGNTCDTRVTIIGRRAFAFARNVRPGDFRASGSGDIDYDISRINPECLRMAFNVARAIGSQSLAFDFVLGEDKRPWILEISYCYDAAAVQKCHGHWDEELNWHEGRVWPQDAILIDLLTQIRENPSSLVHQLER